MDWPSQGRGGSCWERPGRVGYTPCWGDGEAQAPTVDGLGPGLALGTAAPPGTKGFRQRGFLEKGLSSCH